MAKKKNQADNEGEVDLTTFLSSFRAHKDIAPQLHEFQNMGGKVNELINDLLRGALPHALEIRKKKLSEMNAQAEGKSWVKWK